MSFWKRKNKIKVRISPVFLLVLALFAAVDDLHLLLHILLAAALHECGHVFFLRFLGGEISAFYITAFGGELQIKNSNKISYGKELISVLAGPAVNIACALLCAKAAVFLTWERGYLIAGIHMSLALFNLLPVRMLDGGRAIELLLSWIIDPIYADHILHTLSGITLGCVLCLTSALQGMIGLQISLIVIELWFIACWCSETGIVKPVRTG